MENTVVLAGTLTVGAVASFLAQMLKTAGYLPKNPLMIRGFVALACLALSAAYGYLTGTLDVATLGSSLMSYFTAAAAYDHLFKS